MGLLTYLLIVAIVIVLVVIVIVVIIRVVKVTVIVIYDRNVYQLSKKKYFKFSYRLKLFPI